MDNEKPIVLYPFRKRDELTGKWYRARWKASLEEIDKLGDVVDGEPEIRYPITGAAFNPYRPARDTRPLPKDRLEIHPQRNDPPQLDATERFLALTFLRRYVTYSVRRGRNAQACGAAILWRELKEPSQSLGP